MRMPTLGVDLQGVGALERERLAVAVVAGRHLEERTRGLRAVGRGNGRARQ
jgi:hypothetical protein